MLRFFRTVLSTLSGLLLSLVFGLTAVASPSFPNVTNTAFITGPVGLVESDYSDNVAYDVNHAPPSAGAVTLYKDPLRQVVELGDLLPWRIHGTSSFPFTLTDVRIVDLLPLGVAFVPGTTRLTINNVPQPAPAVVQQGQIIIFELPTLPTGETFSITFDSIVTVAFEGTEATNRAQAKSSSDMPISNTAQGTARIRTSEAFDCSTIIGRVFNDFNTNGYSDKGEVGIAGPRLYALVNGTTLSIKTDSHGRYHIPCADMNRSARGSNVIVKLDERTLPAGFRLTTENPRTVRVTPGKMSRLDFGANIGRVVTVDLNDCVFNGARMKIDRHTVEGLMTIVDQLAAGSSHLKIVLRTGIDDMAVLKERQWHITHLLNELWMKRQHAGKLPEVEIEIIRLIGSELPNCQ